MFRSYGANRLDCVTLIANYLPLQDAHGGSNCFTLDPNGLYEIHLDNNGDGKEDLTFQFRFKNKLNDPNLNVSESHSVTLVRADRRTGTAAFLASDDAAFITGTNVVVVDGGLLMGPRHSRPQADFPLHVVHREFVTATRCANARTHRA